MDMTDDPRFLRVELDVGAVLGGTSEITVGQTLWLPLEIAGSGARVDIRVSATSDEVMPLSPNRVVQLPLLARSVRVCVELFGVTPTGAPVQVRIAAVSDDGLSQGVAVLVAVS